MTKVIIYMAETINGMVAKTDDSAPWSDAVWNTYPKIIQEAGNIIVGRKTFEIMQQAGEFDSLGKIDVCVVSESMKSRDGLVVVPSVADAITHFKGKGHETIVVGGGTQTNTSALKENLVDEIWIDLEPKIFAKGIPLINTIDFDCELKFIESKMLSRDTIQIRYAVVK